jgi:SAM-dependent methyltransferase
MPPLTVNQANVGDQGDAMVIGYQAAAERIELEIGAPEGLCLDVGCNTGSGAAALQARWPRTQWCGIEPVLEFARMALGRGIQAVARPAETTGFHPCIFQFIFSRHSLEHVTDRAAAIEELRRILCVGGRLYVQVPIEPGGSPNALHVSAFKDLLEFRGAFGPGWKELYWGPQKTVAEIILERVT